MQRTERNHSKEERTQMELKRCPAAADEWLSGTWGGWCRGRRRTGETTPEKSPPLYITL